MGENRLNSESAYLSELVRALIVGSPEQAVEPSAADSFCWDRFQVLVAKHPRALVALLPLLISSDAPWEIKTSLAASVKPLRDHSRLVMKSFFRVVRAFEEAAIDVVVLKGPVLAATVYANPEARFITDIDLLVDVNSLSRAGELIRQLGFERPELLRPDSFYKDHHFHFIFADADGIQVELHWQLTEPSDYVQFDLNSLRRNVRSVSVVTDDKTQQLTALGVEDGLLHLVSQAMPGFNSLGRLIDVGLILHAHNFDRDALILKAQAYGLATPLWLVLGLVEQITDREYPQLRQRLRPSFVRRFCLASLPVKERLMMDPAGQTGISHLLSAFCCPSIKQALAYVGRLVWHDDQQLYRLNLDPQTLTVLQRCRQSILGAGVVTKMAVYLAWRTLRALLVRG